MPGIFIDVEVDDDDRQGRRAREEARGGLPGRHLRGRPTPASRIVEENLDECVLCDLCVEAAPDGGVRIVKLYE